MADTPAGAVDEEGQAFPIDRAGAGAAVELLVVEQGANAERAIRRLDLPFDSRPRPVHVGVAPFVVEPGPPGDRGQSAFDGERAANVELRLAAIAARLFAAASCGRCG